MYTYEACRDLENRIWVYHDPTIVSRKHFHNCMECIYVVDGHAKAHVDGEVAEIHNGQIVAVPCFSTHYYSEVKEGKYIVVLIPRRYFREYDSFFNSLGLASIAFSDTEDKQILSLINMLDSLVKKVYNQPDGEKMDTSFTDDAMYFIASLLVNLCIQNCGTKTRIRISSLVADAVCIIEDEFRNPLSVADVCRKTGYNQKDLTYHFNKTMNMSIANIAVPYSRYIGSSISQSLSLTKVYPFFFSASLCFSKP